MGEYLSLISAMEEEGDLAPPATLYTKEFTQMLRIDRHKFHALVASVRKEDIAEKVEFMEKTKCLLKHLTDHEKIDLLPKLIKETFRPNQILIQQGKVSEWIFFIIQGRCQVIRIIRAAGHRMTDIAFNLWVVDEGEEFGYEEDSNEWISSISVLCKSYGIAYKLHKTELEVLGRQHLVQLLRNDERKCPADEQLLAECSVETTWKAYREERLSSLVEDRREDLRSIQRAASAPHLTEAQNRYFRFIQREPSAGHFSTRHSCREPLVPVLRLDHIEKTRDAGEEEEEDLFTPDQGMNILKTSAVKQPRRDSGLLANVVGHIVKRRVRPRSSDATNIDSRELARKFQSKETLNTKIRQGWIFAMESYDEDLRNPETVAEINTQELINSAREEAKKQARKVRLLKYKPRAESPWTSALETEQALVSESLAFNRYRSQFLKKRLSRLRSSNTEPANEKDDVFSEDDSRSSEEEITRPQTMKSSRRTDNMTQEEIKEMVRQRRLRMMQQRQNSKKKLNRVGINTGTQDSGSSSRNSPTSPRSHADRNNSFTSDFSDSDTPVATRRRRCAMVNILPTRGT